MIQSLLRGKDIVTGELACFESKASKGEENREGATEDGFISCRQVVPTEEDDEFFTVGWGREVVEGD